MNFFFKFTYIFIWEIVKNNHWQCVVNVCNSKPRTYFKLGIKSPFSYSIGISKAFTVEKVWEIRSKNLFGSLKKTFLSSHCLNLRFHWPKRGLSFCNAPGIYLHPFCTNGFIPVVANKVAEMAGKNGIKIFYSSGTDWFLFYSIFKKREWNYNWIEFKTFFFMSWQGENYGSPVGGDVFRNSVICL